MQVLAEHAHRQPVILGTVGLCCEAAGANAEETEIPVQQIEEQRADGDAADGRRIGDMSYDGHINQSHQRDGDVG